MILLKKKRAFISTATAFTFVPMIITSMFLLCHVKFPGIMDIHKWVGLAFVLLCLCHIPINWSVLRKHLSKQSAIYALAFTILLTSSMLLLGMVAGDEGFGRHDRNFATHMRMNGRY